MTTPTDYRALCAELADALDAWQLGGGPPEDTADADLITRARTALAQPEPEGPTDDELLESAAKALGYKSIPSDETCLTAEAGELIAYARAVLARWGRPAIKPVPVSERPWERDGWCDAEGCCWWGKLRRFQPENRLVYAWGRAAPGRLDASIVCLPHWAMPVPPATTKAP